MHDADTVVLGGRYELGELLGRGGAADVHRARDRVLDRPVAVKMLRQGGEEAGERARFTAEGRMLARLQHPHLVSVLDAGTEGDRPYLVMQLVEGPTLAQECRSGALRPEMVATLGTGLADALAHVHETGMVHRDIKPGNVLLDAAGHARLSDFGIARLLEDATRHTSTGVTLGTAAYLAPEQVRGEEVTGAADVYALGLVLLEALTGDRQYTGPPTEVALARLHRSPRVPDDLPGPWPALLRAMTAMEPQDRPTAAEVARALDGTGAVGGGAAGAPGVRGAVGDVTEQVPTVPVGPAGATGVTRQLASGPTGEETTELPRADDTARLPTVGPGGAGVRRPPVPPPAPEARGDAGGPAGTRPATGRTRRGRAAEPGRRGLAVLLTVLALLVVGGVAASLLGVLPGRGGATIPDGVPTELQEPLQQLHDAVEGDR